MEIEEVSRRIRLAHLQLEVNPKKLLDEIKSSKEKFKAHLKEFSERVGDNDYAKWWEEAQAMDRHINELQSQLSNLGCYNV
jgi:hypothetical protein